MKIGLLTYYGDLNCGTNLQAYATFSAIKSVYPNDIVEVIPFHGFKPEIRPYKSFNLACICRDIVRMLKYKDFKRNKLNIRGKDPIIYDVEEALKYIASFEYDKIYVGADTLLELDRINIDGLSAYWLKGIKAEKTFLAASAKNVTYENLSARQKEEMKEAVGQISHIGVRDSATIKLLSYFRPTEDIHHVPDPTFTMQIDKDATRQYLEKKHLTIPKTSVFMHLYGNDNWADDLAKYFKNKGYYIATPRPYKYSDFVLNDMGPFEQFGIYGYFELVVTHRFHDCVFSLKNGTPFFVYVKSRKTFMTEDNDSKHVSLLKDFGLLPYGFLGCVDDGICTNDMDEKLKLLKLHFNGEKVNSRLRELREEYFCFLNMTIKN